MFGYYIEVSKSFVEKVPYRYQRKQTLVGGESADCANVSTTVRTIYSFDIENSGDSVIMLVKGNGFLYNMIRIMVAILFSLTSIRVPTLTR